MKKGIGALVSGLLLSLLGAALYQAFRAQTQQRQGEEDDAGERRRQQRRRSNRRTRSSGPLDLNSCSVEDLAALPGMLADSAERILEHRPYRNKLDLVSQMVVPEAVYVQISRLITVSEPQEPVKTAS
jgi:DNA uptake protein ComE-like DNA-binding protein